MKKAFLIIMLIFVFSSVFCFSIAKTKRGGLFKTVQSCPKGKVLIYIYRPTWWARIDTYMIYANNVPVIELLANSYYPFITKPGKIVFSNKTGGKKKQKVLNAVAGKTYYMLVSLSPGFFTYIPQYGFVDAKEGLEDLKKLHLAVKK